VVGPPGRRATLGGLERGIPAFGILLLSVERRPDIADEQAPAAEVICLLPAAIL